MQVLFTVALLMSMDSIWIDIIALPLLLQIWILTMLKDVLNIWAWLLV